ncbi:hypothetical protein STEG23_029639, partial [Scotinomys teguina]
HLPSTFRKEKASKAHQPNIACYATRIRGTYHCVKAEQGNPVGEKSPIKDENLWIASRLIWFDQPRPPDCSQTAPVKIGPSS